MPGNRWTIRNATAADRGFLADMLVAADWLDVNAGRLRSLAAAGDHRSERPGRR